MLYIDSTEEMPAQNGGESKKQKADSNENITEASEYGRKCILGQCGAVLSAAHSAGGQNGEDGKVQDNKSINENADHSS